MAMNQNQVLPSLLAEPALRSRLGLPQEYSKEQWEAHKPVIFQLYNVENKPFKFVKEILCEKHKFSVTKRQFYRRINEWGIGKNFKNHEMQAAAETLESYDTSGVVNLKGRQVKASKIQKWRKRQGKINGALKSCRAKLAIDPMDQFLNTNNVHETLQSTARHSSHGPAYSISVPPLKDTEWTQDSRKWDDVDIPGSPKLSRLFEKLQLEYPTDIPLISISTPIEACAHSYILDTGIEEFSDEEQQVIVVEGEITRADLLRSPSSVTPNREVSLVGYPEQNLLKLSFDEWAVYQWDFSAGRPFHTDIRMSLMKPLSPFPIFPGKRVHHSSSVVSPTWRNQLQSLKAEEELYQKILRRFENIPTSDDAQIAGTLCRLAEIHEKRSEYQEQEGLLRRATSILRRFRGFNHRQTLNVFNLLVDCLIAQGKYQEANNIHQPVHAAILRFYGLEEDLTQESIITMANSYYFIDRDEEADRLDRQILQIRLSLLGPSHPKTLGAMRRLAISLRSYEKFFESERLLSIAVQLQQEEENVDEGRTCRDEIQLSDLLRQQGRHTESWYLALRAAERAKNFFGPDYDLTLRAFYKVAKCLQNLNGSAEGERILQETLEKQSRLYGCSSKDTKNTRIALAEVLYSQDRHEEAVIHLETIFKSRVEDFGIEHDKTINDCDWLGYCYEEIGRYEDALDLYQKTIDQLRNGKGNSYPAIAKVQGWITELRELILTGQERRSKEIGKI